MINPNTKVVPIDHGWANMKTEQDVFTSGVSEITTEPALFNDVLECNNKYYKRKGAVALMIEKSLNGSFLFAIFCIKLAIIFSFFCIPIK